MLMYPPETVIAEKFEAMVRFGETNGRIKDFYDIWLTIRTFEFDLAVITSAVGGTFRRRETAIPTDVPAGLGAPFAMIAEERGLWTGFLRRSPHSLIPPPFNDLQAELRRFFGPVINSLSNPEGATKRWNPNSGYWD